MCLVRGWGRQHGGWNAAGGKHRHIALRNTDRTRQFHRLTHFFKRHPPHTVSKELHFQALFHLLWLQQVTDFRNSTLESDSCQPSAIHSNSLPGNLHPSQSNLQPILQMVTEHLHVTLGYYHSQQWSSPLAPFSYQEGKLGWRSRWGILLLISHSALLWRFSHTEDILVTLLCDPGVQAESTVTRLRCHLSAVLKYLKESLKTTMTCSSVEPDISAKMSLDCGLGGSGGTPEEGPLKGLYSTGRTCP